MSSNGQNPLKLFIEWIGDQMYGVWLLFRPISDEGSQSPSEGTQPDEASPTDPGGKIGE